MPGNVLDTGRILVTKRNTVPVLMKLKRAADEAELDVILAIEVVNFFGAQQVTLEPWSVEWFLLDGGGKQNLLWTDNDCPPNMPWYAELVAET